MHISNPITTLVIILFIILAIYIVFFIKTKKKIEKALEEIIKYKPTLDSYIDLRFAAYEKLIGTVEKILPLNETFFKEVVQLRTISHAARVNGNVVKEFTAERKISLVSKNLNKVLGDYPELRGNKDITKFIRAVVAQEEELQSIILRYNILLDEYHSLIWGMPGNMVVLCFKKLKKELPYNR
jgi:hypothetical protein